MTEPVVLGRLGRPHGIRGEIRAEYYAESPLLLEQPLLLRAGRAAPRPVRVTSWRYWQGRLILRLDGVDDRSAAELLRGQELLIEGARLPEADEDEAYLHDMIDLPVRLEHLFPLLPGHEACRPIGPLPCDLKIPLIIIPFAYAPQDDQPCSCTKQENHQQGTF